MGPNSARSGRRCGDVISACSLSSYYQSGKVIDTSPPPLPVPMQKLESEEWNVTLPSGGRSKTLNRPHFRVALEAREIAVSRARHSLGEEPLKAGVCQPRHSGIFPG